MKKMISFILAVVMVLGLAACGGNGTAEVKTGLQAGWGRENITPTYSVPMGGYSDRVSSGYRDYLYMTCIALSDGVETILVYTMDMIHANTGSFGEDLRLCGVGLLLLVLNVVPF